jgi:hypothetical protein
MEGGRKRKIETRGAEAAEEEQRKKLLKSHSKVHCNYCQRDVSDQMYIKSAVITSPVVSQRPARILGQERLFATCARVESAV